MTFVREICTTQVFNALRLPHSLLEDEKLNFLEQHLIFEIDSCSALIIRPFHYSSYPDRQMDFYVEEKHFIAWELIQPADGPERVEIYFNKSASKEERAKVTALLQEAVGTMRDGFRESPRLLPIVGRESGWS